MEVLLKVAGTIGWSAVGIVLLYASIRLFDLLDPLDYREEIRKGNVAAGVILAAVIISISAIVICILITP